MALKRPRLGQLRVLSILQGLLCPLDCLQGYGALDLGIEQVIQGFLSIDQICLGQDHVLRYGGLCQVGKFLVFLHLVTQKHINLIDCSRGLPEQVCALVCTHSTGGANRGCQGAFFQ